VAPFGLEGKECERHVRILIINHRADDAGRELLSLVPQFFACLIKLLLDFRWRSAVAQGNHSYRQTGPREGFSAIIPAQFL
jgi:hypothetical protein